MYKNIKNCNNKQYVKFKESNNTIIAIKKCNISKLESYIEKNGLTINA